MKKIILISSILLTLIIGIYLFNYSNNSKSVLSNNSTQQITNFNAITMMYETESGSGEYKVASDTSWPLGGYTFNSELSKCENGSTLTWDAESKKVLMQANTSDKCYVYFDLYIPSQVVDICKNGNNLASCIMELNTLAGDGTAGIYYHDEVGTYINADQEAGDNSYRYSGANPDNYICFGSNEMPCPNDNLYRIIGVFNGQIKLIKYDYAGTNLLGTEYLNSNISPLVSYRGNLDSIPAWEKNFSREQINNLFLNNIGNYWADLIVNYQWYSNTSKTDLIKQIRVKEIFENEIILNQDDIINELKIGLMYISDYGYAASPDNWTKSISYTSSIFPDKEGNYGNIYDYRSSIDENWMYMGMNEFVNSLYVVSRSGSLEDDFFIEGFTYNYSSIRPTFYLQPDILYVGGDGTESNPYRISAS